jgi:hypothetical protein
MRLPNLIGRGDKSTRPPLDRLFVLSHAHMRLEREHQLTPRDTAAIVFHPVPPGDFVSILRAAEDAVGPTAAATRVEGSNDPFAFGRLVLHNEEFDDLVAGVHAISVALEAAGWWEKLLCALFSFADERRRPTYWAYNYQSGTFYPIAPKIGSHRRDTQRERLLKGQLRADDTVEPELGEWFPLWGIPI